ncbi:M56 family metallopeptidase [Streptomyces sp. C10-9-1]|uniref:M56 family metallopeptidase n=1 Tax=Streptomyces sp. C10-9-1 TaxID=1859285 RepID=UPI002113147C|nr:M56 family metallopeptidase [Streptomyces sp. C10-9-1]MCQ6554976.1 M56 family metallopeptidase [Streptomyces sp. C10-9-1]
MNAAPVLLGYAAVVGVAAPRLVIRGAWRHRVPALGAAVWFALLASFTLATVLAASQLAAPTGHLHAGLLGLLHACGLGAGTPAVPDPTTAGGPALAMPLSVVTAVVGAFLFHLARAGLARARHRDRLDKVGVRSDRLRATVLAHGTPAAYCLPGLRSRIVVSDAAVRLLTEEQLDAVLAHERAHVVGRHHLVVAAAEAFATVFPWLPLARRTREETAVLLEMIADDRTLRSHSHEALATAMYAMAAGRTPKGAFGAGGATALLRIRRILGPRRATHPALRGSVAAVALAVPLLPLLVACPPGV